MTKTTIETIGCDLGDKTSEICVLPGDGSKVRATVRTTRKGMTEFFTRAPAQVVIEVGAHSRWVNEVVKKLGHRVTVANPRRVQLICWLASGERTRVSWHRSSIAARVRRKIWLQRSRATFWWRREPSLSTTSAAPSRASGNDFRRVQPRASHATRGS